MQLIKHILLILSLLIVIGCEGQEGATGPVGEDGAANIITISKTFNTWEATIPSFQTNQVMFTLDVPELTSDIFLNGLVIGYMLGGDSYFALPTTMSIDANGDGVDFVFELGYAYNTGSIDVYIQVSDFTIENDELFEIANSFLGPYKFVLVPPASSSSLDGIDLNDYDAVMEEMSIK